MNTPFRSSSSISKPFLRFSKPRIQNFFLENVLQEEKGGEERPSDRPATSWEEESEAFDISAELKRNDDLARLEAVLFLSREPLSSRKLAQFAEIADATHARRLIRELNQRYDQQPCAFRIVEVAGGYQLRSRPQFASWLVRLQEVPIEIRLSATALETLAVVAFRQPVLRAVVESIRGVQCGEILRQLMERNLVKIVGRSEELGRPFLYGTTKFFLQVFGLNRLEELSRKIQGKSEFFSNEEDSE